MTPAPSPEPKSTCYIHCPTCKQTITTYCNIQMQITQEREATIRNATIKEIIDYISPDLTTGNVVAYLQSLRTQEHK